jgi:hypothetical protein
VFLALVVQQATRMSRIIFSSVASAAVQIFLIMPLTTGFWEKQIY